MAAEQAGNDVADQDNNIMATSNLDDDEKGKGGNGNFCEKGKEKKSSEILGGKAKLPGDPES